MYVDVDVYGLFHVKGNIEKNTECQMRAAMATKAKPKSVHVYEMPERAPYINIFTTQVTEQLFEYQRKISVTVCVWHTLETTCVVIRVYRYSQY